MTRTIPHAQRPAGAAADTTSPHVDKPARVAQPLPRRTRPGRDICGEAVVLLQMAQAGDRDAFAALYRAYEANVRRYIAVRMRDRDRDAIPDLVQDTFCAALAELDRAHHDVRGWLVQLAAKMCTRHSWAARRYLRAVLTTGEQQRSHAASPPGADPAAPQLIAQALAELEPDERRTVQLRFLDGHPREATAAIMDCSLWTVRQTQKRALQRLATRLADRNGQPPRLHPAGPAGRHPSAATTGTVNTPREQP